MKSKKLLLLHSSSITQTNARRINNVYTYIGHCRKVSIVIRRPPFIHTFFSPTKFIATQTKRVWHPPSPKNPIIFKISQWRCFSPIITRHRRAKSKHYGWFLRLETNRRTSKRIIEIRRFNRVYRGFNYGLTSAATFSSPAVRNGIHDGAASSFNPSSGRWGRRAYATRHGDNDAIEKVRGTLPVFNARASFEYSRTEGEETDVIGRQLTPIVARTPRVVFSARPASTLCAFVRQSRFYDTPVADRLVAQFQAFDIVVAGMARGIRVSINEICWPVNGY